MSTNNTGLPHSSLSFVKSESMHISSFVFTNRERAKPFDQLQLVQKQLFLSQTEAGDNEFF